MNDTDKHSASASEGTEQLGSPRPAATSSENLIVEKLHATRDSGAPGGAENLLAEGSRFGGYIVGPCIGEGGMARIYRAEHEGLQRQVALKVLLDGAGRDGDGHERFLREARLAAVIKHPNVVNIFDVGVHGSAPYLVMELLDGVDLETYLETQGALDEPTIMDVMIPIVAGLAAVHDAGIVHRDLKPGNIFLAHGRGNEVEPRLLDFGISKSIGPDAMRLTSTRGLLMGTPFYMSPEAARGLEMTSLSDQYALGVVLYECATGVNPFANSNTFADVVRRVTTGDYPPISSHGRALSKKMTAIIERAMQLDPARRFPDMRAMGRELLQLAGQRTRITWGLSFSELSLMVAPATGPRPLSSRPASNPAGARRTHLRSGLYVAIAAGLTWVGADAFFRSTPALVVDRAPIGRDDSVSALRLKTKSPSPAALPSAPLATPRPPVTDSPVSESPPVAEVKQALRDERPTRSRSPRSSDAARPARIVAVSAAPKAAATDSDTPEWLVSANPPSAPELGMESGVESGTNNAPIFE